MYESEINDRVEDLSQLPRSVIESLTEFRDDLTSRSVLPWGEHCTECVWPTCYTSCDLYSPREDGKCRRFVQGMVRIDCPGAASSYLLKIQFKRWGKLWSTGNIRLHPLDEADRIERRDRRIGQLVHHLPLPSVRNVAIERRYGHKKRLANAATPSEDLPTHFVVECYNPGPSAVDLSLCVRSSDPAHRHVPYQRLISVPPGFHRELVPYSEMRRLVDLTAPFGIDITPNEIEDGTTLYFGLIDFASVNQVAASDVAPPASAAPSIKCIVWDLDNTMWSGILVEDGPDELRLKPGVKDLIEELDRRGVLHSIASKNNFEDAMEVLARFGLEEYFLHPQISWGPKSDAIKTIAARLNIGLDTFLFVDDSPFELAEVASNCPAVRTQNAEQYLELLELQELDSAPTEESATRRLMYQQQALRETVADEFTGNYLQFLRDCQMEMRLDHLSQHNLDRVHELTQRTNQMNFSGNRYTKEALQQLISDGRMDTYVLTCQDRFGSYGIVGFSVVDPMEPRMIDLMFSCRVQSKRVEHAFMAYLIGKYRQVSPGPFRANYRRTPKNEPSGKVFDDIGMEVVNTTAEGVSDLRFDPLAPIPVEGVVDVQDHSHSEVR